MAQSFNLNSFLQEYRSYNSRQYTAAENGRAEMEQRDIERAQEAVQNNGLLSLTLREKFAELGIGEHVVEQLGSTALNMVTGIVDPIANYLEKYENIFDNDAYTSQIQAYAKQMFFAKQALSEEASSGAYIVGLGKVDKKGNAAATATKFFYTM